MGRETVLYHNPRCSKSRQTLALLEERGVDFRIVEYLKDPPSAQEVLKLAELSGIQPHELVRTKEPEYREAGLCDESSDEDIASAIAACPKLLERPIVVHEGAATIGRPPERVLEILD